MALCHYVHVTIPVNVIFHNLRIYCNTCKNNT